MRTLAITTMLTGMAFIATGAAHADIVSVPVSGTGLFKLSDAFTGASVSATVVYTRPVVVFPDVPVGSPSDGAVTPWSNITVDRASNAILSLSEIGAGATITTAALKSVSTGGSLTITDLSLDLVNKQVKATLIGGNGVGTLTNFTLWNIDPSNTLPGAYSPGASFSGGVSGLSITQDGLAKFSQALGLLNLGKSALTGVTDYGTISWSFATPAVPEASTWAMTLLGLSAIGAAVQRRRKQA